MDLADRRALRGVVIHVLRKWGDRRRRWLRPGSRPQYDRAAVDLLSSPYGNKDKPKGCCVWCRRPVPTNRHRWHPLCVAYYSAARGLVNHNNTNWPLLPQFHGPDGTFQQPPGTGPISCADCGAGYSEIDHHLPLAVCGRAWRPVGRESPAPLEPTAVVPGLSPVEDPEGPRAARGAPAEAQAPSAARRCARIRLRVVFAGPTGNPPGGRGNLRIERRHTDDPPEPQPEPQEQRGRHRCGEPMVRHARLPRGGRIRPAGRPARQPRDGRGRRREARVRTPPVPPGKVHGVP